MEELKYNLNLNHFLQQQVRSMVGCLKYLAEKKMGFKKI